MTKKLQDVVTSDGLDIFQYHGTFIKPFFTGYSGFEKRSLMNNLRMSCLSILEPYQIYYAFDNDEIVGFVVVCRGGARLERSTDKDIILGPINICKEKRGCGYGTRLIHAVLKDMDLHWDNAYEFIHEENIASIRSAEKMDIPAWEEDHTVAC